MNIIDIGCNLTSSRFSGQLERIIRDARSAGVIAQILTGTSIQSNEQALALANTYPDLYATAGFHPHHANDWYPHSHRLMLQSLGRETRCVAVGETGLDYFRNLALPANQRKCFADQLDIAKTLQKPVFLHERHAYSDFAAMLTEALPELSAAVWHCFTGTRAQMEEMADCDLYFGITGWICDPKRGATLRETVRYIPDERLMLETDAPYLTPKTLNPVPTVNEPQYLPEVLRVVAQSRQQSQAEIARITTDNAVRFFNLPLNSV